MKTKKELRAARTALIDKVQNIRVEILDLTEDRDRADNRIGITDWSDADLNILNGLDTDLATVISYLKRLAK